MRKALLVASGVAMVGVLVAVLSSSSGRLEATATGDPTTSNTTSPTGPRPAPVIYRPANLNRATPVPLVIMLHGAGSGPAGTGPAAFEQWTRFDQVANQYGFVVAYLSSPNPIWRDPSNIQYIRSMITHLTASENIDRSRVYVVGFSLGGVATFESGCQLSKQLAGIAAVSQGMLALPRQRCPISHPLSELTIVGSNDALPVHPTPNYAISADQSVINWRTYDGCSPQATTSKSGPVQQTVWTDCNDGRRVAEYIVQGGTHWWPGAAGARGADAQYSASQAIWSFLSPQRASSARTVAATLLSVSVIGSHTRRVRVVLTLAESSVTARLAILHGHHRVAARRGLDLSRHRRLIILLPVPARLAPGRYELHLALADSYGRKLSITRTVVLPH